MANLHTILAAFRDEVEARVVALTPDAWTNDKFHIRPIRERADKPIRQVIGRNRLAELSLVPIQKKYEWIGSAQRGLMYDFPLVIVYEDTEEWHVNLNSDADLIYTDLNSNPSSGTGICLREVNFETPLTVELHGDDPWMYSIIPIRVYLEIEP